jgi:hypothetical protein
MSRTRGFGTPRAEKVVNMFLRIVLAEVYGSNMTRVGERLLCLVYS